MNLSFIFFLVSFQSVAGLRIASNGESHPRENGESHPTIAEQCGLPGKDLIVAGWNEAWDPAGWGSKVNNFMNVVFCAEQRNQVVAVRNTSKLWETWNSYMQEPSLPTCHLFPQTMYDYESFARNHVEGLATKSPGMVETSKRAIYNAYYQYTNETRNRIDKVLQDIGLPKDLSFYGVHLRGGDKAKEASIQNPQKYSDSIHEQSSSVLAKTQEDDQDGAMDFELSLAHMHQAAEHILSFKDEGIRTVFLSTIDQNLEQAFRRKLGSEYEIKKLPESVSTWDNSAETQYYPGSQSLYDVLTDVEALRRSRTFIGTGSSNMGRLVYFLRRPNQKSISLDLAFTRVAG